MASFCKYYASNGKESNLFNELFSYYRPFYNNINDAEKKALEVWLPTNLSHFKNSLSPSTFIDENGEVQDFETAIRYFSDNAKRQETMQIFRILRGSDDEIAESIAYYSDKGVQDIHYRKENGVVYFRGVVATDGEMSDYYYNSPTGVVQLGELLPYPVVTKLSDQTKTSSGFVLKDIAKRSDDEFVVLMANRLAITFEKLPGMGLFPGIEKDNLTTSNAEDNQSNEILELGEEDNGDKVVTRFQDLSNRLDFLKEQISLLEETLKVETDPVQIFYLKKELKHYIIERTNWGRNLLKLRKNKARRIQFLKTQIPGVEEQIKEETNPNYVIGLTEKLNEYKEELQLWGVPGFDFNRFENRKVALSYDLSSNMMLVNIYAKMTEPDFHISFLGNMLNAMITNLMREDQFGTIPRATSSNQQLFTVAENIIAELKRKGDTGKHLSDPAEFYSRFLSDNFLRNRLAQTAFSHPEIKVKDYTIADYVYEALLKHLGIRAGAGRMGEIKNTFNSMLYKVQTLNNRNNGQRGFAMAGVDVTETSLGAVEIMEDEDVAKEPDTSKLKVNKRWAHRMTGDPLIDNYINAHIEKVRSIEMQDRKKGDRPKNRLIAREAARYKSIINLLHDLEDPVLIFGIAEKDFRLLTERLKSDDLDEIGENIKLLTAWASLTDKIKELSDSEEISSRFNTEVFLKKQEAVVGQATRLRSEYMSRLVTVFKERAAAEHVPPEVIAEINMGRAIEDIGSFASLFMGLSTGQDPYEIAVNYLIRRNAFLANDAWDKFSAASKKMFDSVGNDIDWMFIREDSGKMRIQTPYQKELYDKMAQLRDEIHEGDKDRKELRDQIIGLKTKLKELNRKKRLQRGTDVYNAEIGLLKADILNLETKLKSASTGSKSWDAYMEFLREHFVMDLMKVAVPKDANDPRAGTTVTIRYSEMTAQEKEWALEPWEQHKKELEEVYTNYNEQGKRFVDRTRYNEQINSEDPIQFINWINGKESKMPISRPTYGAQWFAIKPKDNWKNTAFYNGLSETQREFYDWFVKEFIDAHEDVSQESLSFGEYEQDKLLREFVFMSEDVANKLSYLKKDIRNVWTSLYATNISTKTETSKLNLPLSNEEKEVLRLKSFENVITKDQGFYKKGDTLPADIQAGLTAGNYQWNDDGVLVTLSGTSLKRIVPRLYNPVQMFYDYKKISLSYKYKKDIEDILTTAKELLAVAKVESKKKYGKAQAGSDKSNIYKRLAASVDAYLYDKRADPITSDNLKQGEVRANLEQIVDSINKFTRYRQLGLNPASGITNLVMGTINNYQYAAMDEAFNESDLHWAYWKLKSSILSYYSAGKIETGDAKKIMLILKRFGIMNSLQEEMFLNDNDLTKLFDHLFVFQKGGEYLNQGAVVLAMMRKQKVKDKNGNEISLYDAYQIDEDGTLKMTQADAGWDINKEILFSGALSEVIKEIHGDYDPLNFKLANKKTATRVLMTFRTWMPMAIAVRLRKKSKNNPLSLFLGKDVWREGRWRTFARAIAGVKEDEQGLAKFAKGLGRLSRFFAGVTVSTFSRKMGSKVIGDMGLVNDYEQRNLAVMMKEVWWLLVITSAGVMTKRTFLTGDDDEKERFFTWFFNQTSRIENDLWFYYSPTDFSKVVRDPIAMWSTLNQAFKVINAGKTFIFNHDKDEYVRGFRKGDSKFATQLEMFLPVVRQRQTIWSMLENVYSPITIR